MNVKRLVVMLVAGYVLTAGALALAGNKSSLPSPKYACGGEGHEGCPMMKSSTDTSMVRSLSADAIAQIAGDKLTEKNKSTVEAAVKHHQALVRQANTELVSTLGKTLHLDADQKKQLQCAVDGCTANCSSKGCKVSANMSGHACPMSHGCSTKNCSLSCKSS